MKPSVPNLVRNTGRPRTNLRALVAVMALHAGLIGMALHRVHAGEGVRETVLSVQLLTPLAPSPEKPRPLPPPPRPKMPEPVVARVKTSAPVVAEAVKPPPKQAEPPAPVAPPASPVPAEPAPAPALQPPRFDADYLSNPSPIYPILSRRLAESGKVLLRVQVATDGHAAQVLLQQSSGYERLDNAAREAVAKWRFVPARRGDEVLAEWVIVPVVFSLNR